MQQLLLYFASFTDVLLFFRVLLPSLMFCFSLNEKKKKVSNWSKQTEKEIFTKTVIIFIINYLAARLKCISLHLQSCEIHFLTESAKSAVKMRGAMISKFAKLQIIVTVLGALPNRSETPIKQKTKQTAIKLPAVNHLSEKCITYDKTGIQHQISNPKNCVKTNITHSKYHSATIT